MNSFLIRIIKLYQFFISPLLGVNCRFHPSCSEYAKESIVKYGSIKGIYLAFLRIIRCQPFCNGGYDPVDNSVINNDNTNEQAKL